ncbi:MAG: glyoxylase I family protein [Candidatus Poriferisodalaceae bacterium]|jgi:glyoxylase I family protein
MASTTLEVTGVQHVSINVTDLDRAKSFYLDKLGLTVLPRPELRVEGVWLSAGEQEVHLVVSDDTTRTPGQHFAFGVTDLDGTMARLQGMDIKVSDPIEVPNGARQCFIKDTEGNLLEFNQPPS